MSDDKERAVNLAVENTISAQGKGDPDDDKKMGSGGYAYDQNSIKQFLLGVAERLKASKPIAYKFVYPDDEGFAKDCLGKTLFDVKFLIDKKTRVA